MPAKRIAFPTKDDLLTQAANHESLSSLARANGIKSSTFISRLRIEGWHDEVVGALGVRTSDVHEVNREEILEQRIKELEQAHRASRKLEVFEERALAAIEGAIEVRRPTHKPKAIRGKKQGEHEMVLLWSDLHAGEVVSEEETGGNAYDWRIMMERHTRLREAIASFVAHRPYPVRKLHVLALGDMLSGDIHDELVETNEVPLAEATIQLGIDGAEWLASLLDIFDSIDFSGVVGNHPRSSRKPQAKHAFNNADWLAYHTMRLRLREELRIGFNIPKAPFRTVTVADRWKILMFHGDSIRSSMPGVPWGGVTRRVNALQSQFPGIDMYACGHFHSLNLVQSNAGRIAMNGSIKGVDEYSLKAFGGGSAPQQMLLTFHRDKGLTDMSICDLEPPR